MIFWINLSAFDKATLYWPLSDCSVLFDKVKPDIPLYCTATISRSSSVLTFFWRRRISQATPLLLCFVFLTDVSWITLAAVDSSHLSPAVRCTFSQITKGKMGLCLNPCTAASLLHTFACSASSTLLFQNFTVNRVTATHPWSNHSKS